MVLNIFKTGAFFPMNWVVNDTKNKYYYEAVEDVEVWRAPKDSVSEFVKTNPDILYNLLSRVYKGVDGLLSRMSYLMTGNAYDRLIAELLIYARRFGNESGKKIELHISEKDLAISSGLTRETVSRTMHVLKEKNLVIFSKNILVIPDLQLLEAELVDY